MKMILLTLHRKESYPEEYAPEVMSVVDEITLMENPSWWPEEVERQKNLVGSDASAWAEIEIEVPTDAIMAALYPKVETITATVVAD